MKEISRTSRSRRARVMGVALTAVLLGTAISSSASAANRAPSARKYGGELTVAMDATISGFCFSNALSGGPLGATRTVYESLVERDNKGNFVPYLAQSFTMSADAKYWTIALRAGIKYSNGEEFNAANVKQNIDIGRGAITSYPSTGIGVNANILAVDVIDNLTVKVTLDRPDTGFLGLMYRAGRYVMRAPAQIVTGNTACATKGIGTGPFMIASFSADELVAVKNPTYWRKDASGGSLPYLDKITFINVKEASQRAAAVRKGSVDAAFFTTGDATFIKDLQGRKKDVKEFKGPITGWGQWMPNVGKANSPFKFQNCRLAAAFAVDWKNYNIVRLKGMGSYNGSIVGKTNPMYTLDGATGYNVAKAKEFVAKCNTDLGAAGPFKLTLYADTSTQSQNNVKFVAKYLTDAGILLNNTLVAESAILIASIYRGGGNLYDFAEGTPAEGDAVGYVIPFFISKAFNSTSTNPIKDTAYGKGYNTVIALGAHGDEQVDRLIYAAQADTNPATAKVKWAAASAYLMSMGYTIPTVHAGSFVFTNNKSKLVGVGTLKNPDGSTPAVTETKGFEWTGVSRG